MAIDTEKRNQRQYKWQKENRDRINLIFSKGIKEEIATAAAAAGVSRSAWVESAIVEKLHRET